MCHTCHMRTKHTDRVDLNLLVVLQRLLETGSVTAAAERLRLSQPAVSRALGRLRDAFGDVLFVRTPEGLRPTPRAEQLRLELGGVLSRVDALIAGPGAFSPAGSTRAFALATADYGATVVLPRLLRELAARAPGVRVRVLPAGRPWEAALAEGEWDLVWAPRRKAGAGIVWTHLLDERFAFVVRKGHPAARPPLTLQGFAAIPQIAIAPEGRGSNPLDDRLARLGTSRKVVAQVPSFLVALPLVAGTDLGVTLPRRLVRLLAPRWDVAVLDLPFDMPGFDLSQAWHERFRHDPAHAWFRQLAASAARRDR
jgi:DNA-binding transcriptional LysR family regulator